MLARLSIRLAQTAAAHARVLPRATLSARARAAARRSASHATVTASAAASAAARDLFHARAISSSARILRAAEDNSKKAAPLPPTNTKINHLAAFSSAPMDPENSFVSAYTVANGCQRFRMGTAASKVIADAFMHSLKSTDAKPTTRNPDRYTVQQAATYGGHPGAVGFFGPNGATRLQELKGYCKTINGEVVLFQSTYESYAALVRKNVNSVTEKGFFMHGKGFW
jgi:hypothetical protein